MFSEINIAMRCNYVTCLRKIIILLIVKMLQSYLYYIITFLKNISFKIFPVQEIHSQEKKSSDSKTEILRFSKSSFLLSI